MKSTFVWIALLWLGAAVAVQAQLVNDGQSAIITIADAQTPNAFESSGSVRYVPDVGGAGRYVQTGTRGSGDYARAVVLISDSLHRPIWALRLNFSLTGGNSYQASYGVDLVSLGDNQFVLLAAVNNFALSNNEALQNLDFALIRFRLLSSNLAEVQWAKCYGGDFNDVPHRLLLTQDGALLASGYSNPEQALNVPSKMRNYLVKTDLNGNNLWNLRYSDGTECNTGGLILGRGMTYRPACETSDGGYVFASNCDERAYVTKVSADGAVLWTRRFVAAGGISDGINSEGLGTLGLAAGSFGSIVGIEELSDGRLAFLGNQVVFLAGLLYVEDQQQLQLGGVGYPMGYLFTTSSTGEFEAGTAFFREKSYADPNNPIEMLTQDLAVLDNGNLLVAAGVRQYGDANGNSWHIPALLEINPTEPDVNEAIRRSTSIHSSVTGQAFYSNDNARSLSGIRLNYRADKRRAVVSSNFSRLWRVADVSQMGDSTSCEEPIRGLYSFPIELDLASNPTFVGTPLTANSMDLQLSVFTIIQTTSVCTTVSTTEVAQVAHPITLTPSLAGPSDVVVLRDEDGFWRGAQVEVFDLQGRMLHHTTLQQSAQVLDLQGLTSSMFVVRLRQPDGAVAVLRGVRF
jgi:hypothetical protein